TLLLRHSLDPGINILTPKPAAKPWMANVDSNQIVQALLNLGVNARDAMPQGGTLTLALENISFNATDARPPRRVGDFVRLMFADTGPGVPAEVADRIFEPCFAGKHPGQRSGIGLAIASAVVAEHSGWMEVESPPGRGARFSI